MRTCLLLYFSLFPLILSLSDFSYSDSRAREYWYYQIMTECASDRIQAWNVTPISTLFPHISDIQVIYNSTGDNLGYTAYNPDKNLVFVAFAGTHGFENWLEDFDAFKITYDKCDGCEVHQGFYGVYQNLKDKVLESFIRLTKKYPGARRAVIGHSLGGATASLTFLDLIEMVQIEDFYSFGIPRVGNEAFANYFNGKGGETLKARITHYRDPVPHLPFDWLGYKHLDREVFYDEDGKSFVICESGVEDQSCSLQFNMLQIDPNDHTSYMGFDLNPVKASCQ